MSKMATYEITSPDGKRYQITAPENVSQEQLMAFAQQNVGTADQQFEKRSIDPEDLQHDPIWLESTKRIWKTENPGEYTGSNKDLAEWGLDRMARFNYNLTLGTAVDAVRMNDADVETKKAFLYMMDTFDHTEHSWAGTGRFAKQLATDPANYGLALLGGVGIAGKAATVSGQQAAKVALREALKTAVRYGVREGVINSAVSGVQDSLRQSVEMDVGARKEYSPLQTATSAAIGFVAGTGISAAVDVGARALTGKIGKEAARAASDLAGSSESRTASYSFDDFSRSIGLDHADATQGHRNVYDHLVGQGKSIDDFHTMSPEEYSNIYQGKPSVDVGSASNTPDVKISGGASQVTTDTISLTLPKELAGAKPRFSFGKKAFGIDFASDIEKALFITSQKTKSKADEGYRQFLREAGYSDKDIDTLGQQVRSHIKEQARIGEGERLSIGEIVKRPERAAPDASILPSGAFTEVPPVNGTLTPDAPSSASTGPLGTLPASPEADAIIKAVEEFSATPPEYFLNRTKDVLNAASEKAANLISQLGIRSVDDAVKVLQNVALTGPQRQNLFNAVQMANRQLGAIYEKALKDFNEGLISKEALEAIEAVHGPVDALFKAHGTESGLNLGNLVGEFAVGERREVSSLQAILERDGLTMATATEADLVKARQEWLGHMEAYHDGLIDDVLRDKMGVEDPKLATPEQRAAAEAVREADEQAAKEAADASERIAEIDKQQQQELEAANVDWEKVAELADEKDSLNKVLQQQELAKRGWSQKAIDSWTKVWHMANDYATSMLFGLGTLTRNASWGVANLAFRPFFDVVNRGLDEAAFRAMGAHYSTYLSQLVFTARRAAASFHFERDMATMSASVMGEYEGRIPGWIGRKIRTIPRIMQATDQVVRDLTTASTIEGKAVYDATIAAKAKGLVGDAKTNFIEEARKRAVERSYQKLEELKIYDLIRQDGIRRGLSGTPLRVYTEAQFQKKGDLFVRIKNLTAYDEAKVASFTQELPKSLAWFEKMFHNRPFFRIMSGQFFIRSPLNIANTMLRLTPGAQALHVGLLRDLVGSRGPQAKLRAEFEVLLGSLLMSHALYKYGMGEASGTGPDNYKINRNWSEAEQKPTSAFKTDDGWLSIRGFDPLAGVYKIVWSTLDRYNDLMYKRSLGEMVNKSELENVGAQLQVPMLAITSAIRDANLWEGPNEIVRLVQDVTADITDKRSGLDNLAKYLASKVKLTIPNVFQKLAGFDETLRDPKTFTQYLMSAARPSDDITPKQYDALGNVRKRNVSWLSFLGFDYYTNEMLTPKIPEKDLYVLRTLSAFEITMGDPFNAPYRDELGHDMRETMTVDGKKTRYDRWQELYKQLRPEDELYNVFTSGLPIGTPDNRGSDKYPTQFYVAKKVINEHRKAAYELLMREEIKMHNEMFLNKTKEAYDLSGQANRGFLPY